MANFKRLLAIVMVLVFAFALVSCGKNENKDEETTANNQTTKAGSSLDDTSDNSSEALITDASGNTVTVTTTKGSGGGTPAPETITQDTRPGRSTIGPLISRTTNKNGKASQSFIKSLKGFQLNVEYPWGVFGPTHELGQSGLYVRKQVEDEFGVKINEGGQFAQFNERLAHLLLTKDPKVAHVTVVQSHLFASFFKNGYMSDLTKAMDTAGVDFKDPWYNPNAKEFLNIDNNQLGWISYDSEFVFPYSIIFNKTLFDRKKLADPATLAERGQWTWDKMVEYSKRLTAGSTIGLGGSPILVLTSMVAQQGSSLVNVKRNTQPSANLDNQIFKDSLGKLAQWTKDDKILNRFKSQDWTYGKVQLAAGNVAMLVGSHDPIKGLAGKRDKFGVAPFPMPKATKNFVNVSEPLFIYFVPKIHQNNADKILFVRNEMYRHSYRFSQRDFQILWEGYFGNDNKKAVDDACNLKYSKGNYRTVFDWTSVCEDVDANAKIQNVVNDVLAEKRGISDAISAYSNVLTKRFNDVWQGHKITGNVK